MNSVFFKNLKRETLYTLMTLLPVLSLACFYIAIKEFTEYDVLFYITAGIGTIVLITFLELYKVYKEIIKRKAKGIIKVILYVLILLFLHYISWHKD